MPRFKILSKDRLIASQIFGQAFKYLVEKYGQAKSLLTPASPLSQILTVTSEITELIFYYIENIASEMDIRKAKNKDSVNGMARLTGHNPTRGISAIGKISMKLKPGADQMFTGDYMVIPKYTKLTCLNNNLQYFIMCDNDTIRINRNSTDTYEVHIIQGDVVSTTFRSDGKPMFSFTVNAKETTDHNMIYVLVNGERWETHDSLYDLAYDTKGCVIKTGINGGFDVYFGTGSFGVIPPAGAAIEVRYIVTAGSTGNIGSAANVLLRYDDMGYDKFGEEIDLNDVLHTSVIMSPSFGSDSEMIDFTRLIAPKASRSYVLANPDNYVYFLRKYNYFSMVQAFTTYDDYYLDDDNVVYLFLLPDITKKITSDTDYFEIDENEFTLTAQEKDEIKRIINESGQMLVSTELKFVDPIIKRYALNIVLRYFDNVDEESIRSDVRTKLNDYFLNIKRRDKIPRSDIISIVENIDGVDSVNVYFVSEDNETAIRSGYYYVPVYGSDSRTGEKILIENKKINLTSGENPNLGIDEFGDINIEKDVMALIRGGWYDRNEKYYETLPDPYKMSALNIFFKDKVKYDLYNQMNRSTMKKLNS